MGSAVAIALGLVEALKAAIAKIGGSGAAAARAAGAVFNHTDRNLLRDLHAWHAPESGRQEWKNPETRELLGEILAELVKLNARAQAERGD